MGQEHVVIRDHIHCAVYGLLVFGIARQNLFIEWLFEFFGAGVSDNGLAGLLQHVHNQPKAIVPALQIILLVKLIVVVLKGMGLLYVHSVLLQIVLSQLEELNGLRQ